MRGVMAGFLVQGLGAASALGDASAFGGTWVNTAGPDSGIWSGGANADDIARIQLYGRCQPECHWGSAFGHDHSACHDYVTNTRLRPSPPLVVPTVTSAAPIASATPTAKALGVLRTYHVARQCSLSRDSQRMVYWLSK